MSNAKILLAEDHKIVRDGLRTLIGSEPGMEVVAEAEDGRSAVRLAHELSPDVIIMDIAMPDMNGIDATRVIIRENPKVKVIALSMYSDRRFVSGMLEAGASGYLLKDCAFEELVRAIRSVMSNQIYLSPTIAGIVVNRYIGKSPGSESSVFTNLTPREREILQILAEGMSTKKIAYHLNISVKTVETHRRNIMEKLNIHSISELVKYAIREGLTSQET
ncbi:MAG: response regulator transcription factor [Syntrophales bacterium]|jgi:DNA-binding NarL/FixJ family response regulator|nr:response regulator transcription factor [Syntrophales bacterium]